MLQLAVGGGDHAHVHPDGLVGAHAPDLSPRDIECIHLLWVEAVKVVGPNVHHRDIITAALRSLEDELEGTQRETAIARLRGVMTPCAPESGGMRSESALCRTWLSGRWCRGRSI